MYARNQGRYYCLEPIWRHHLQALCKRATSVAHLTNFSFEFFYKIFTEDASLSLLYHGAKKSKMTKNSNQGGPALMLAGGLITECFTDLADRTFLLGILKLSCCLQRLACTIMHHHARAPEKGANPESARNHFHVRYPRGRSALQFCFCARNGEFFRSCSVAVNWQPPPPSLIDRF